MKNLTKKKDILSLILVNKNSCYPEKKDQFLNKMFVYVATFAGAQS